MAVTKFEGLFLKPKAFDTRMDTTYETVVCTMKMTGMTANSPSLSAVNWEANLVKTTAHQHGPGHRRKPTYSNMV